ncbi:hypothetical protein F2Q69_00054806, partial [Brassica cretica]
LASSSRSLLCRRRALLLLVSPFSFASSFHLSRSPICGCPWSSNLRRRRSLGRFRRSFRSSCSTARLVCDGGRLESKLCDLRRVVTVEGSSVLDMFFLPAVPIYCCPDGVARRRCVFLLCARRLVVWGFLLSVEQSVRRGLTSMSSLASIQSVFVVLPSCPPLASAFPPVLCVLLGCSSYMLVSVPFASRSAPWFSRSVHVRASLISVGSTGYEVSCVVLALAHFPSTGVSLFSVLPSVDGLIRLVLRIRCVVVERGCPQPLFLVEPNLKERIIGEAKITGFVSRYNRGSAFCGK